MQDDVHRQRLTITGQVQGVGFRPFVYRLATELRLTGWVRNDSRGVTIEVQGGVAMEQFVRRLHAELPPLAQIHGCQVSSAETMSGEDRFDILPSAGGELADAQVTVDTAVCADCLREMNAPADPRYGYAFINCTNCGPRYSIVRTVPYDRPNTTMADFAMCPLCAGEYGDPASRRFHAQPVACPACGPSVWLVDPAGRQVLCDDPIAQAADMLRDGRIVAVKGLGGFHLACRADRQDVVARLRRRKRRDAKPFALMVADLKHARALCDVSPEAERLLTGPLKPVVLMPARRDGRAEGPSGTVCLAVADGLDTLGVMLPYTPLHYLLFERLKVMSPPDAELWPPPLVMTSGNYSDEPLEKDNESAIAILGPIADAILLHNRRIERRVDDSVVQVHRDGALGVARRGRSYAPRPVRLEGVIGQHRPVLAVGAELKNTICLLADGRALLSEHIGDLTDGRVYRHFIDTIHHLERLFEVAPEVVAADMHPQYLSTEYALRRWRGEVAGRPASPIIRVQHHHAHIVSCLAEHGRSGPVIGLACDGVGYGDDGAAWGCEVLRADLRGYERLGHLRYLPLPGGDAAAVQTWRPAMAALHDAFGEGCLDQMLACRPDASVDELTAAMGVLQVGINCPPCSSLGRWFDAVAWLCGVADANRFEAEAAMKLESAAADGVRDAYAFRIEADGPFQIDLRPMVEGIVTDRLCGLEAAYVSAKFHNTVARFLAAAARRAAETSGLSTVVLSGGCFANRYLTARLADELHAAGLEVLRHHEIPCNDGGVALGQAVVTAARHVPARHDSAPRVEARRPAGMDRTENPNVPGDTRAD